MDGGLASSQPPTELPILGYVDLRQFMAESAGEGGIDRQSVELDMLMGEPGGLSFGLQPTLTLEELRRVAREVDPRIAVEGVTRMGDVFSGLIGRQRFYAVVLTLFGG